MCHFRKKGRNAQVKTLEQMWKNSNTEEQILQEIQRCYGHLVRAIFGKGQFVVVGDLWVLVLDEKMYEILVETTGKFFFELEGGIKVKPWTGDVSKLYRAAEVGKWLV